MYSNKDRFSEAVSPVVSVVLMVAVAVILAAVIGGFVLDLGENVGANPQAGITIDESKMNSGQDTWDEDASGDNNNDQGYVVSIDTIEMENADEIRVSTSDNDDSEYYDGSAYASYKPDVSNSPATSIGEEITVTQLTPGDEVTVTGELDGKETVLQTHTVNE